MSRGPQRGPEGGREQKDGTEYRAGVARRGRNGGGLLNKRLAPAVDSHGLVELISDERGSPGSTGSLAGLGAGQETGAAVAAGKWLAGIGFTEQRPTSAPG